MCIGENMKITKLFLLGILIILGVSIGIFFLTNASAQNQQQSQWTPTDIPCNPNVDPGQCVGGTAYNCGPAPSGSGSVMWSMKCSKGCYLEQSSSGGLQQAVCNGQCGCPTPGQKTCHDFTTVKDCTNLCSNPPYPPNTYLRYFYHCRYYCENGECKDVTSVGGVQ